MKTLLAENAVNFDQIVQEVLKSPNIDSGKFNIFTTKGSAQVAAIVNLVLPYIFIIAGILLLFYLIAGGFQMMTSPGDEKAVSSAKAKITNALVGFILLFISYWIVQIIQTILGFSVL